MGEPMDILKGFLESEGFLHFITVLFVSIEVPLSKTVRRILRCITAARALINIKDYRERF